MKFRSTPRLAGPCDAHFPVKPVALAVALALASPHVALAGPTDANVVSGQARVTRPDAKTTLIKQDSDKAIINWRSFSIGAGQSVRFEQPGSNSVALNRVTSATPSDIQGSLSANGKIFLINPSGILFGKSASVDVGGLVASTLDIRDQDFLSGRYNFTSSGGAGVVRNQGRLSAAERGTIALLGAEVSNEGTMSARLGTVGMAAGGKVSLDFAGDGLTRIVVDAASINALVENGGAVLTEGGQVIMSAHALGALAGTVVRNTGVIQARSLVERDGRIMLDGGSSGKVELAGTLDANGAEPGRHGGAVTVTGKELHMQSGAEIDTRGATGGGAVLVGGGERGADPAIRHASSVTMDSGSAIHADALETGDGGKIVLWSDGTLAATGALSARGGAQGGNGGFIETSGKTVEIAGLRANASAAKGMAGTWLLDPDDLYIGTEEAQTISDVLTTGTNSKSVATGSITVAADIIKRAPAPANGPAPEPTDATLYLEAGQDIIMYGGPTIRSDSGKLHVDFNANSTGIVNPVSDQSRGTGAIVIEANSRIQTNGGDIWLYGQSDRAHGSAIGSTFNREGISIDGATLNACSCVTGGVNSGRITMRGAGHDSTGDSPSTGGTGIYLRQSDLLAATGSISLDGTGGMGSITLSDGTIDRGQSGIGVEVDLGDGANISTTSGNITIWGKDGGTRTSTAPGTRGLHSAASTGLLVGLNGGSISSNEGTIELRGNSDGMPVEGGEGIGASITSDEGSISTSSGGIRIFGEYGRRRSSIDNDVTGVHPERTAGLIINLHNASIATWGGKIELKGENLRTVGAEAHVSDGAYIISEGSISTGDGDISIEGTNNIDEGSKLKSTGGYRPARSTGLNVTVELGAISTFDGKIEFNGTNYRTVGAEADESVGTRLTVEDGSVSTSSGGISVKGTAGVNLRPGDLPGSHPERSTGLDVRMYAGSVSTSDGDIEFDGLGVRTIGSEAKSSLGTSLLMDVSSSISTGAGAIALKGEDGRLASSSGKISSEQLIFLSSTGLDISIGDSSITTGSGEVSLHGLSAGTALVGSSDGTGLSLFMYGGDILSGGRLGITGIAHSDATTGLVAYNNGSANSANLSAGANGLWMAGRGTSNGGLQLFNVKATATAGGSISVAGESSGAAGITFNNVTLGDQEMSGAITLRASTGDDSRRVLDYGEGPSLVNLRTSGRIMLLPGGVQESGMVVDHVDTPIRMVDDDAGTTGFTLSLKNLSIGQHGPARVVVGSIDHKGAIHFEDGRDFTGDLTLQNGGAGSKGITLLQGTNVSGQLTLSSGGNVTVDGSANSDIWGITASSLLLHGTQPESNFQLAAIPNQVGSFSALLNNRPGTASTAGGDVNFRNRGPLRIDAPIGHGYSPSSGTSMISASKMTVAGDLLLDTSGNLTLGTDVETLDGSATLLTGGILLNAANGLLSAGGGWRVFADTWVGEVRGPITPTNPRPNFYGCGYGSPCAAELSGNRFIYRQRPTLTLKGNVVEREYGSDSAPGYTATGLVNNDSLEDAAVGRYSSTSPRPAVGTHATTGTFISPVGYEITVLPGSLTVTPATLLVRVDDKEKIYGGADPLLTASLSGFKYEDTAALVSGLTFSTATGAAATAGTHPITAANAQAANYRFVYQPGTLTVDRAALQVIVADQSKTYGGAEPTLSASFSGLVYGDTAAVVSGLNLSTATGAAASAGSHAIVGSGATAANYRLSYQDGVLTVDKAPLEVNIADRSKTYGGPEPTLSASYAGFLYGDTDAVVSGLRLSTATGKAATAGTHAITGADATAANYRFVYRSGVLTVDKAALQVFIDDKEKTYGDPDPQLTASFSGLQYDDGASDITGLNLSTASGAAATAGTHTITGSEGSAANYTMTFRPGTLTVNKAPLLVIADDKQKVYGDPEPAFTASASGLKYSDTAAVVRGLAFAAPAGALAGAGRHAIAVSNGSADNYTLNYRPGTLLVAKAPLTITADNKAKVYGAADPALTATISGFKYGDTSAVVQGLALSTATGQQAVAGTHAIVAANASASNYDPVYVPGTLAVDQAVLTYVATPATQFQDVPALPLSGTVTGFAYGETLDTATTGTLVFTPGSSATSLPGNYGLEGGGLSAANYRFVQSPANGTALTLVSSPILARPAILRNVSFESSSVYGKNFGTPRLCVGIGPLGTGTVGVDSNDLLALEWSRVRVSPNLSNCLGLGQRNSCSDF